MINPYVKINKAREAIHGVNSGVNYNAQTTLNNNNPPKQENDQHWTVRGLATLYNVVSNLVEGAVKSIEGIVDAGAMLVGLFGADVDEFVSYDMTSDIFGTDEEGEGLLEWSWGRNLADASYLDNDNIVNQIAEGVGGMLPTVALAFVSGGTSLAGTAASAGAKAASIGAKVANVASKVAFVAGAAGNASESALQEGATYGQALGYGATAGAIEGVTEMIGGRAIGKATELTDTMLGKFLIRKGWDKAVSKGIGKMAYSFASEGLEEVISDLADPVSKYAWGINDTLEMPTLKDLGKTFVVGGSVGAVLDSFSKGASAIKNHEIGGKSFVKVAENLEDISNTNKALAYLQQHKGITQDRLNNATIRSSERTMDSIEKISKELQSMTDEQRKLAFDTLRENTSFADDTFNSDGTIKEEVRNDYAEVMNKGAIYNVSTDLVYKGKALENVIRAVNEEHKMNLEISDTAFTENQRKSFAKINRSIAKLNEKVGERISIVAIKDNPNANALINKNTIFINEKYLENGKWARYLSHEISHFARKSKEFNSFAQYITSNDKVLADVVLKVDGAYKYDFDFNTAKEVISKVQKGETVSKKESDFYDEVVAHITEDLFTNEESINRLVKNDSSLAQKILNRIKQFLQIFKGTNADSKTVIDLRKAELLFEKALSSIGKENKETTESVDNVLNAGNELDNSGEIRYSKKGYSHRNPNTVTQNEYEHHYWAIANNLLSKDEIGLLDSLVGKINKGEHFEQNSDGFYMLPVGEKGVLNKIVFTDGKRNAYSINTVVEIALDNETDLSIERENIYERESKGIQTETNGLLKVHYSKTYRFSDFKRNVVESLQDSYGEQDGARSDREIKFSIKDSDGNTLSPEQQEYFKNSKVVDKDGNLLKDIRFSKSIIDNAIDKAINQKGDLGEKYNQIRVSRFPDDISQMVAVASDGNINLLDKYVAISGHDIWHEYQRHSNTKIEISREQIPLTKESIKEAVESIYSPDIIESLFSTNENAKERKSFAYAKKSPNGYYIVVEAVGGRRNPNVVPVMILNFSESKWNNMMSNGYTLGEILYENDEKLKSSLDVQLNKKNRVIVAQFASNKAIANTPHSPQFNSSLSQSKKIVNTNSENFSNQIKNIDNKNPTSSSDIRFSKKITAEMSDSERYDILKDKKLVAPYYDGQSDKLIESEIDKATSKVGKKTILTIADKLGIVNKEIYFKDAEVVIELSNSNLKESFSKKANPQQIAKLLPILDEVAKESIVIERHNNRYFYDTDTVYFNNLIGGYIDGDDFVPIRFGLKYSINGKATLYVIVDQNTININKFEDIKKDRGHQDSSLAKADSRRLRRPIDFSLSQIFKFVNNKDILRYIPDDFLIDEQKTLKYEAIAETIKKTNDKNDKKYVEYIKNGNLWEALQMVKSAAKVNGYTIEAYHGSRNVFTVFDENKKGSNTKTQTSKKWFFASDKETANSYYPYGVMKELEKQNPNMFNAESLKDENRGKFYHLFLKIENPLVVDVKDYDYASHRKDASAWMEFVEEAERNGNDGIILYNAMDNQLKTSARESTVYMFRKPSQAKSAETITYDDEGNIIPISKRFDVGNNDIRFSRTMSSGEYAKAKANLTQEKVYSKKEATSVVNEIIDSIDLGDDITINIANKSKEQVANEIWKFLNDNPKLYRVSTSEKIADYIIDSMVLENALTDDDNQDSIFTINAIKPYLHSFDLSHIKDEIKYRHGHGGAFALWGARKGKQGLTADQVAQELEGKGIYLKSITEADMFFEIIDMYSDAVRTLKEKGKKPKLNEALTDEDLAEMRKQIKMDILNAFDKKGSQTAFAKMIIESSKKAEFWKVLYYDEKNRNRAENDVVFAVERLDSLKKGESVAHTEFKDEIFNKTIGVLTKLKHKKSFNRSGTRNVIETLRKWATDEKNHLFKEDAIFQMEILPLMGNIAENKTVGFDEIGYSVIEELQKKSGYSDIRDIYEWYTKGNLKDGYNQLTKKFLSIYANEKKFTVQELKDIAKIVNYFRSFVESYNQIQINNERMDAFDMTKDFVKQINKNASRKYTGSQRMYLASVFNQKTNYYRMFIDGKAIARAMDRYENGVCTFIMDLLEQGEVERALTTMNTLDKLDKFYEKHKKFQKKVEDKRIKYLDKEIPLGNAMLLYMELKSDDALRSLCASGFAYTNKDNKRVEIQGFNPDILDNEDALQDEAKKLRDKLENQFDEVDMQFIKICEDLFNNKLRKLKVATDEQMLGFSNVIEGYYVPKMMADRSMKLEADKTYLDEVASVSNQSFNKSRIKGAYGRLSIESLPMVMKRHAEGIIKYHSFAQIERTINIVRNLDVGEDSNNVQTVNTEMKKVWKDFDAYFNTLYKDIRGVSKKDSFKLFSWLRGNYAKAVLGLNVKVLASQLSSYGAAGHILSIKALSKGVFVKSTTAEVYKYCPLAEYRRKENVSAQSQGVIDDVSSKFLEPIGFVDGFVINRLFGACQVQVEKDNNLKIGTEENKVKAGELLKKVILETQQNNFKASQVEGARSDNELLKSFTMFKSDAIKNFGRWLDAYGELIFAKDKEAKKKAGKKLVKSSVVLISQASYLALLTSLFSHLFNTDDEDENDLWGFITDAFGNLFGGIPIIGDFINSFTSGFDVEDMAFGTINDVIDSARNFANMFDANTDSRERARTLRSLAYSITSVLGLPVKNAYKLIYGTINLASPETAYQMDDFFYKQSYSKDLAKAMEKGDEGMLTTITGLIMGENVSGFTDKSREEVSRLSIRGYDALPQSVGDSMTIGGNAYELTTKVKNNFKKVYSQSITAVDKLVSSNGYKISTDEAKAKAIKYVYRYYYYEAQHQALNVDLDSKLYLFGQIVPIEKMALALAEVPLLVENSTNKKTAVQRYLQASKLTSAQKYMLMGYFGYKNTKGEGVVKSAINKTSLTKEQKKLLLEKCGY